MKVNKMTSLDLSGKRVLIREDLNVPIKDGVVTSDARIRAALPTIQAALNANARVLLMSHLGRPEEGKFAEEFSLAPVAKRLTQLLGVPVALKRDWLNGVDVAPGEVVLLENVRFNKGEKKNDDELAKKMAALCDVYVMDAFGTAHRAEASTHGVAKYAPIACAGPLLVSELTALETALEKPARPLLAIVARLQGVDQAHRARDAARQGRSIDRGRRHCQHLSRGARLQGRQIAARTGDAGHLQAAARAIAEARHRHSDADRRRGRHGVFRQGGGRRQAGGRAWRTMK